MRREGIRSGSKVVRPSKYKRHQTRRPRYDKKYKKRSYLVHYKDLDRCRFSFSCRRRFRSLLQKYSGNKKKRQICIEIKKDKDRYAYSLGIRFLRKLRKTRGGWRKLDYYNVFHWEKDYSMNDSSLKKNKKILIIKSLHDVKKHLLYVFFSMCQKQKYFLNNVTFLILSTSTPEEYKFLIRDIVPIHRKYLGITSRLWRTRRSGKPVYIDRRIKSFAVKLFIKSLKRWNNTLDVHSVKKNDIYNIIINACPTKFHKLLKISNYILLLRYRTVLPFFYDNSIYFNFECLRINPLTYIRRGCLFYENRPGSNKIVLRNYWFRKNKLYLP
jgi:hypothetical protein